MMSYRVLQFKFYKSAENMYIFVFVNYCTSCLVITTQRRRDTSHRSRERRSRQTATQSPQSLDFLQPQVFCRGFSWSVSCVHIIAAAAPQCFGRGTRLTCELWSFIDAYDFHVNVLRIVVRAVPCPCRATYTFGNVQVREQSSRGLRLKLYIITSSMPCWQLRPVRLHLNRPAPDVHSYPCCSTRVRFLEFIVSCVRPPTPKLKHDLCVIRVCVCVCVCVPVASHTRLHSFYSL